MVDDPSARPELFPTEEAQSQERQRLFRIIEDLVKWESTTNETVLEAAREEIRRSWRRTCETTGTIPGRRICSTRTSSRHSMTPLPEAVPYPWRHSGWGLRLMPVT